jgi:histidinol-phosphatase (PHP family)
MRADYHTHTYLCGHASGTLDDYIRAAIECRLDEIGLTDHLFLYYEEPDLRDPSLAMREEQYPSHYDAMVLARDRYRDQITVRVSVEADWVASEESRLREVLGFYEFDYVLGGVHYVDGWLVDAPDNAMYYQALPLEEIWRSYMREIRNAAESRIFDVLAHVDLPKKFGHHPPESVWPEILQSLDCIRDSGCAVEISTVGLRDAAGACYPSPAIIAEMKRREIPIVLSSDAHAPAEVAFDFDQLVRTVSEAGYTTVRTFQAGDPRDRPLG